MNKEQQYAVDLNSVITQLFDEESESFRYELDSIDLTAFFTGLILEFGILYKTITEEDLDMIGVVDIINRLTFQYLMKGSKEKIDENNS